MKSKKCLFALLVLCAVLSGMFAIGCGNNKVNQGGDSETSSNQDVMTSENKDEQDNTENTSAKEELDVMEEIETTEEIENTEETEKEDKDLPEEAESALKEDDEILKITPSDDSVNNGSGSSDKEVYEAPSAASADNPIVKNTTGSASTEFASGSIPAGKTWYYKVTAEKGYYFCIEDENASIICDGKTYSAEGGRVLLLIQDSETEFAIKNKAKDKKNFTVAVKEIEEFTGTLENPKSINIATDVNKAEKITRDLKAGDEDGYYYLWKATNNGKVDFTVSTSSLEELKFDLIITSNGETVKLSEVTELDEDGTSVTVTATAVKGKDVLIQVIAKKTGNSYPAVKAAFVPRCRVEGTEENPIEISLVELPDSMSNVKIPAGKKVYFEYTRNLGGTRLSVEGTGVNNLKVYQESSSGVLTDNVISLVLEKMTNTMGSGKFVIENTGTTEAVCTLKFEYLEGTLSNPSQIMITEGNRVTVSHNFNAGDEEYYYQWKVPSAGKMKFDISATTDVAWQYAVICEKLEIVGDISDSILESSDETVVPLREYTINANDLETECVFIFKINTYAIDSAINPAGTVSFTLSFEETSSVMHLEDSQSEEVLESESTEEQSEDLDVSEMLESTESTEAIEFTEATESTEITESEEKTECVEELELEEESGENTEQVEITIPLAFRLIRNWCIRLFSK